MGDFETTVYEGQQYTEVWASAVVELGTEDVLIHHSIEETFEYFKGLKTNVICYYHNLKFDGAFWLSYLLDIQGYKQALSPTGEWLKDKDMPSSSIKYMISDRGQWYTITIKIDKKTIQFRDSLKLLPFSVKRIGTAFKTKHQKLDMEYHGFRYAGCTITPEEQKYIANDVLVVKEALEMLFDEGHKKTTIGSNCLAEYKRITGRYKYKEWFPDLTQYYIDPVEYGYNTADEYIRRSYRGGWCYLVKGKENKTYTNGTTADVNSLYPSMMSSESGNRYPVGEPTFWKGDYIPEQATIRKRYYFVRIKTRFYIKDGMLPFIQIKGNPLYDGTESLTTSDVWDSELQQYCTHYYIGNTLHDTRVTMTMTMTDFKLFMEHYEVVDFEIIDGCYFETEIGIFDDYIEKYKKIKVVSKGAKRELAKLFLNNLYGKMASNTNSSFKEVFLKDDKSIGFTVRLEHNKKAGYIPVGSAITSYARNFTIRSAQQNYYGVNERGFIYADTDSIHCDLQPDEIKGIQVHPTDFCCWKLESCWDVGHFTRQKTYIEHITHEDLQPIETPYYNVKCAGMPERCKQLFIKSLQGYTPKPEDKFNEEELQFLSVHRTLDDFKIGLRIWGKLMPKRIRGGIVLVETSYEMR